MDFVLATLFLILYYVRPHEWNSTMATLQPITKVVAAALVAVFYYTGRRVHWHPGRFLGEFLRTPHDWILLAFIWWLLHAATDANATWAAFYSLVAYYVFVEHALSTPRRIETFLWVWLALLTFVATMAVLSEYDVDPFGSYSLTNGMYKGRLVLNLSIFSNPNALGHSVIMILPMIYFLLIWRRMLLLREFSLPLFIMPLWCLFWTESKGAYISGAAGILTSQTFGRPKWVQIAVLIVAYGVGFSALLVLPRMHELESIRNDQGVKGRLLAWNFAWQSFETLPNGLGYQQFTKHVPVYVEGKVTLRKVTHSSYLEVGAELGKTGLYLWLGILYYCLKTLALMKGETDQDERIRRLLFSLVVIYMISSWMTNISYRGTFFIQTGVVAAYCRHMQRRKALAKDAEAPDDKPDAAPNGNDHGTPTAIESGPAVGPSSSTGDATPATDAAKDSMRARILGWFTWRHARMLAIDAALISVMYRVVVRAWLYFMLDWTGI